MAEKPQASDDGGRAPCVALSHRACESPLCAIRGRAVALSCWVALLPMTLEFERAGAIDVRVPIKAAAPAH